jgi:hypothetical protein
MVRFTRGHLANHVGKQRATNPKLQARPVERSPVRSDSDLTLETRVAGRVGLPADGGDNSLRRSR